MEVKNNMAEPVRNEEPLSSMRFPQSEESARPGPVPVTRSVDPVGTRTLPEMAEPHAPLGEWPEGSLPRDDQDWRETGAEKMDEVRENLENAYYRASNFMRGRMRMLRGRAEVLKSRVESGELQDTVRARAGEMRDTASRQARMARAKAEFYGRNYPLQVVAGVAAGAFLLGFVLRMWRDE